MKHPSSKIPTYLNVPYLICFHVLGNEHKTAHKMTVGACMMITGVVLAEGFTGSILIVHVTTSMLGWFIHALGGAPFLEWMSQLGSQVSSAIEAPLDNLHVAEELKDEDERKEAVA